MESPATSQRWMSPPRLFQIGVVFLILLTGTWLRTRDLAADPLDVSHSQQLIFLLTAKAYQSPAHADNPALPSGADFAIITQDAPVMQWIDGKLAALLQKDLISVARGISNAGWMLASLLLYLLVRRITKPFIALAVLVLMIFLPFSIQFSRVVLPGSWAMVFAILALWQLWRWIDQDSWSAALAGGLLGSVAIILQSQWLYILAGGLFAAWWSTRKKHQNALAQTLFMGALWIAPRLIYALSMHPAAGLSAFLGLEDLSFGISSLRQLVRLELRLESIIGVLGLGLVLIGILLTPQGTRRSLLIGLWAGFGIMCLLSLKAISDSIYILYPVILLSSVTFIPLFETLQDAMGENRLRSFNTVILVVIMLIAAGLGGIDGRRLVKANPEQIPVDFWRSAGQKMGSQAVFLSNTNSVTLPLAFYGGIQPVCIAASGNCLNQVDSLADQMPAAELYFVLFKTDLDEVLAANSRLSLSAYHCDLGSGVMMIPLTSNHPACDNSGG